MKQDKKIKRVLIMAGGTGGHVFPGIAVAQYFQQRGIDVHWLGTKAGLESHWVTRARLPLHCIDIHGLRGKGLRALLLSPFKITRAVMQSYRIIQFLRPDVVIGMGGFVSGPGGIATWLSRCPLIIHEQNAIPGFTNRVLSRFAYRILSGFPDSFKPSPKVVNTGNPVRPELENFSHPGIRHKKEDSNTFRLLILGGSLGAQAINHIMPLVLAQLPPNHRPIVLHQTGEKHFTSTLEAYQAAGLSVSTHASGPFTEITVLPFIENMVAAYRFADMVLCRAGAITLAELCAVGVGSILIPFPFAVDDHQSKNAQFMVKRGASLCIQQKDLSVEVLKEKIQNFASQPEKRLSMAEAAYILRNTHVAEKIFELLQ